MAKETKQKKLLNKFTVLTLSFHRSLYQLVRLNGRGNFHSWPQNNLCQFPRKNMTD